MDTDIRQAAEVVLTIVREDEDGFWTDSLTLLHEYLDAPAVLAEVAEELCAAEAGSDEWYDWMDAVASAADDILAAGR
jgi:hypothetical protein